MSPRLTGYIKILERRAFRLLASHDANAAFRAKRLQARARIMRASVPVRHG